MSELQKELGRQLGRQRPGEAQRTSSQLLARLGPRPNPPYQEAKEIRFIKGLTGARHLTLTDSAPRKQWSHFVDEADSGVR